MWRGEAIGLCSRCFLIDLQPLGFLVLETWARRLHRRPLFPCPPRAPPGQGYTCSGCSVGVCVRSRTRFYLLPSLFLPAPPPLPHSCPWGHPLSTPLPGPRRGLLTQSPRKPLGDGVQTGLVSEGTLLLGRPARSCA